MMIVNSVYIHLTFSFVATESSPSDENVGVDRAAQREASGGIGPALRRAWLGYQRQLDEAMALGGFSERRFPDGRVLRLCTDSAGSTISAIGRELGITRQGAGKVVGHLRDRGYVSVADSNTSGREKSVTLTFLGAEYLATQRKAARAIEGQLRADFGDAEFSRFYKLLEALGQGEQVRMRTYLQR
jgi:DNA-binding MarR family transcriptional regulator